LDQKFTIKDLDGLHFFLGSYNELWEKTMKNALRAKNKHAFIDGTLTESEPKAPESYLLENLQFHASFLVIQLH
jgi:gag-polypeptide of LTR copia-type